MLTDDAIKHYGSRGALAKALDLEPPSVYGWGDYPPPLRQIQIERITKGTLKAEKNCFETKKQRPARTA